MWAAGSGDGVGSWRSGSVRAALCEFSLDAGTFSSWRFVWQPDPHRSTTCSYQPGPTRLPSSSSQPPWVWPWEFIVIAGAGWLGAICTFIVGREDTCHSSSLGFLFILWFLMYILSSLSRSQLGSSFSHPEKSSASLCLPIQAIAHSSSYFSWGIFWKGSLPTRM